MKEHLFSCIALIIQVSISGQMVETVASHPKIVDGLHVDVQGRVYTTPGGLALGQSLGRYTLDGTFTPNFAPGFAGPIEIAALNDSMWYVTNYDNNTLALFNPQTLDVQTVATGLDGPAGVDTDDEGNVFITNFGAPPGYSGSTINLYTENDGLDLLVDSNVLFRPQGIAFDHLGVMYVASRFNGANQSKIYSVAPGDNTLNLFADIGEPTGNMTFRHADSSLYLTVGSRISKLTLDGTLSTLTGSTAGYVDGTLSEAKFQNPLGIAFTHSEDTLYVSEAGNARRLRRITLDQASMIHEQEGIDLTVFPNPSSGCVHIEYSMVASQAISDIHMLNNSGQSIPIDYVLDGSPGKLTICPTGQKIAPGLYVLSISDERGLKYARPIIFE